MTNSQVEVITSVERRRRWSAAEKERLVAASLQPGAIVSALAREAGIHPSRLYGWRRQLCSRREVAADFAAVRIGPEAGSPMTATGVIEVEFASGARMRVTGAADPATVSVLIAALTKAARSR